MGIDYENIIIQVLSGNASEDDSVLLDQWRKLNAENELKYQETKSLWEKVGASKFVFEPNVDRAWTNVESKINPQQHKSFNTLKIAAGLIALIAIGFLVNYIITKPTQDSKTTPEITINDNKPTKHSKKSTSVHSTDSLQEVLLPDSSLIVLNDHSKITYNEFNESPERSIHLTGDAYFDVLPSEKSFVVYTPHLVVRVLGTIFNVNERANDSNPEVNVEEGTVEVSSRKDAHNKVILGKNQRCTFNIETKEFKIEKVKNKHKWWNSFYNKIAKLLEKVKAKRHRQ